MLFVIWLFRRYNSLAQKMIVSLTVAAFFDSVAYVMGEDHPEGALCTFQAWWLTYFGPPRPVDGDHTLRLTSLNIELTRNEPRQALPRTRFHRGPQRVGWQTPGFPGTVGISGNAWRLDPPGQRETLKNAGILSLWDAAFIWDDSSLKEPGSMRGRQMKRPYHVLAWGVPLLMSCLPLFTGYYGPAGPWCWITDNHVAWRFGIWYIPLFSLIFLMICCYVRIIYVANKRMQSWFGTFNPDRERRKVSLGEEIKPLKWYPSVYLLVSLFPLINRIHNALYPRTPVFSLTLMHVFSGPLHGLANAVVFGLDRDIWGQLSLTGLQLALHSRLCDHTRIGEYHPGSVRYAPAGELDLSDSDEDDTNVLFYSPDMALKDRGP
nr:uncharacterized protein LOC111838154 [Paramormyrops kingsleyae]